MPLKLSYVTNPKKLTYMFCIEEAMFHSELLRFQWTSTNFYGPNVCIDFMTKSFRSTEEHYQQKRTPHSRLIVRHVSPRSSPRSYSHHFLFKVLLSDLAGLGDAFCFHKWPCFVFRWSRKKIEDYSDNFAAEIILYLRDSDRKQRIKMSFLEIRRQARPGDRLGCCTWHFTVPDWQPPDFRGWTTAKNKYDLMF